MILEILKTHSTRMYKTLTELSSPSIVQIKETMKSILQSNLNKKNIDVPQVLQEPASTNMAVEYTQTKVAEDIAVLTPNISSETVYKFVSGGGGDFSSKIGVLFSGGQAPGGHNVISGLFDALGQNTKQGVLIGFLNGPSGLVNNEYTLITREHIDAYKNTGGFDLIGSGRTKIETKEQFQQSLETAKEHSLDTLVIIGGDDSNTNAALLANYFKQHKQPTTVIGVPKTIDGDLKNTFVETSFGFDTATRVYSNLISNIARDALSAKKYWHFIKLMGRSASHVTLECALQTQPNVTIIAEEVAERSQSLAELVESIADTVIKRHKTGLNFGIALLPEGLLEFIPEMKTLISEINELLASNISLEELPKQLTPPSHNLFTIIPEAIRAQLLLDRDPHGNVNVSLIETDKLIAHMVDEYIKNNHTTVPFSYHCHFLGYEGRAAFPSAFDASYCYCLGKTAYLAGTQKLSGYMVTIMDTTKPIQDWVPLAIPIASLMHLEKRHGHMKPVIEKALVELDQPAFKHFEMHRNSWKSHNNYVFTGPIQYFGPNDIVWRCTHTLHLEKSTK